jgi:hypothetical protein
VRAAWQAALYGSGGFYRLERPADHFRTSAHVSVDFAAAVLALAREYDVAVVVDVGAGSGELLVALRALDRDLRLIGVEVRVRPTELPPSIDWRTAGVDPASTVFDVVSGPTLLIANELLDNVACDVVELAADGLREVEVHDATGVERLGGPADPVAAAWIERWWPLTEAGQQAVVGRSRDAAWSRLCESVTDGVCVAVDFGHVVADRPSTESPTSYRRGRQYPARFDGRYDVTAPVAVDAVASAVGGRIERQRDVLTRLMRRRSRPSVDLATSDPLGYLRQLSAAGDWRELTASAGLGDFWWIESPRGARSAGAVATLEREVRR